MSKSSMPTQDVAAKLRDRYSGTEWALAFEVPTSTGHGRRRCDALAMGLWPSKGLHLHGHEIKVSRADWLKEIDDPTKAEAFASRCHYWWIVAPKGIVKLEEMPSTWGLLHCTEKTALRVGRAATKQDPEQITWRFFAACMRAFSQQSDIESKLRSEYARGWKEGIKYQEENADRLGGYESSRREKELQRLRKSIAEFEEKSGIKIDTYNGERLGESLQQFRRATGNQQLPSLIEDGKKTFDALHELLVTGVKS